MSQSIKRRTLNLSSGLDPRVVSSSSALRLLNKIINKIKSIKTVEA